MSKFSPESAQIASHADHFVVRHVLDKMPQRTTRVLDVATTNTERLLHCCHLHLALCLFHTPNVDGRPSSSFLTPLWRHLPPKLLATEGDHHGHRRSALRLAAQLQLLLRPAVLLLLRPRGHGQGLAAPSLSCSNRRPAGAQDSPSPSLVSRFGKRRSSG